MNELPFYIQIIKDAKDKFLKQSNAHSLVYDEEAGHAIEIITANDNILKVAKNNKQSLKRSIIKVATLGLTLNKAMSYCYLVSRKGEICLDISYRGLLKLATDSGSILWAKAEIVRDNDEFFYSGICDLPRHSFDPFSKRGNIKGVYCVAKTLDNDYLTDIMSLAEIKEIMNMSKSKNSDYSPWKNFFGEMSKKAIIKRACKYWPCTEKSQLKEAVQHLNDLDGSDFSMNNDNSHVDTITSDQAADIFSLIQEYKVDKAWWAGGIRKKFNATCTEKIPAIHFDAAMAVLEKQKEKNNVVVESTNMEY